MTVSKEIVDAVAKCVEIVEEIDVSDCGDYVWNGEGIGGGWLQA